MQDLNSTTHYFSESQREQMRIANMPIPHAQNAYEKLLKVHGKKFIKTPLAGALAQRALGEEVGVEDTTTEVRISVKKKATVE